MKTQKEIIRNYLLKGKDISGTHALINWGIMRLSSVISVLKKEGLDIKTRRKRKEIGRGSFVVYYLDIDYIINYRKSQEINLTLWK